MQTRKPANQSNEVIQKSMPLQVVDKPAPPRNCLHQSQEVGDIAVGEVMGQEAADYKINWCASRKFQDIHHPKIDPICRIGCCSCNANRFWIEINTDKVKLNIVSSRQAPDCSQQIAIAAANVNDRQWPLFR